MKTYKVSFTATEDGYIEVEADDPKVAVEEAQKNMQHVNWLSDPYIEVVDVELVK